MTGGRDIWTVIRDVEAVMGTLDRTGDPRMSDTQKVQAMTRVRGLADRMTALAAVYTDLAARSCATERTTGTPLSDFLAATEGRTTSEANGLVHQASRISADPQVREAALAGTVTPGQAAAIGGALRQMPRVEMTTDQKQAAAETLIDRAAGGATSRRLTGAGDQVLGEVAPDLAPPPDGAPPRPNSNAAGPCGTAPCASPTPVTGPSASGDGSPRPRATSSAVSSPPAWNVAAETNDGNWTA